MRLLYCILLAQRTSVKKKLTSVRGVKIRQQKKVSISTAKSWLHPLLLPLANGSEAFLIRAEKRVNGVFCNTLVYVCVNYWARVCVCVCVYACVYVYMRVWIRGNLD